MHSTVVSRTVEHWTEVDGRLDDSRIFEQEGGPQNTYRRTVRFCTGGWQILNETKGGQNMEENNFILKNG